MLYGTTRYFAKRWFGISPSVKYNPQEDARKAFLRQRRNARVDQQMAVQRAADAAARAARRELWFVLEDARKAQEVKEACDRHEARKAEKQARKEARKDQKAKDALYARAMLVQAGIDKHRQAAQAAQEAQRCWRRPIFEPLHPDKGQQ
jgi:hypothetical protein